MRTRFRRAAVSLAVILIVAFALRLGFAYEQQAKIPHQALSTVPFMYEPGNIAYSLAAGRGFSSPFRVETGPTAWTAPVYPLLVAAIFRIFGIYTFPAFVAAVLLNIFFSSLACAPIFFAGKRTGGPGVAAGAAWLWAIFPNAVIVPFEWIWDTSLSALLAATILWATLALDESRRARDWCVYGLLWGVTLMTNPTLAALLPLLLAWMAYRAWQRGQPWLGRPALAAAVAVLCCVPWTVRNYAAFHAFVPLRSVLGLQLWLGNNDQYRDTFPGWLHPIDNSAERAKYVRMGEIPYMREKLRGAIQWMASHPRREAELCRQRFIATWTGFPAPISAFRQTGSALVRSVMVCNFLAAVGMLAGIVALYRRRSPYLFPVAAFPIVFPIVFYLSEALLRYRYPVDPMVLLLCAIGAARCCKPSRRAAKSGAK